MNATRKKIMMIDDDPVILKIGRQVLKDEYEVYPLPSAEKLFEALENVIPDLILLDIIMPDVGGVETIKRLKADERYADIPIIFVSSIGDDKSVFEHLKMGAYSNLTKPFSAEEILSRVENCLNDYFPGKPKKSAKGVEDIQKELNNIKKIKEQGNAGDGRKVILAVDDEPDMLRMVYLLLRETYKVHTLSEPEKLETLLLDITPDLFLLDYKMPVLSGTELIPIIRKFPEHQHTPILFLTSEKSTAFVEEASRLGACDFMIKPMKMDILREKIDKHIRKT